MKPAWLMYVPQMLMQVLCPTKKSCDGLTRRTKSYQDIPSLTKTYQVLPSLTKYSYSLGKTYHGLFRIIKIPVIDEIMNSISLSVDISCISTEAVGLVQSAIDS